MKFGPLFADEVIAAGLGGAPFGWNSDGTIAGKDNLSKDQIAILDQVMAAHDPTKQRRVLISKSDIVDRIIATGKVADARAALNKLPIESQEKWAAYTEIYADSPEAVDLITSIGLDPTIILKV